MLFTEQRETADSGAAKGDTWLTLTAPQIVTKHWAAN